MGSNNSGVNEFGRGVTLDGSLSIALRCRKATSAGNVISSSFLRPRILLVPSLSTPPRLEFVPSLSPPPCIRKPPRVEEHGCSGGENARWVDVSCCGCRNTYYRTAVMRQDRFDAPSLFFAELKNVKVGATLVINKDGLSWFSGRRSCGTKTRREAEPQWLMSSGETEEEQQSLVCVLHPNERNVNRKPWRPTDQRSSFLTRSAYFPLSDHDSQKKLQESVFAFPDPVFPESPKTQKGHILRAEDISIVIPNNLNVSNRHHSMNKNTVNGCIILCDDWELFHSIRNWGKFAGHYWTVDNMFMSTLKPSFIQKSLSPITEDAANGNLINLQSHLQICPNSNDPGESAGQDGKRKKSVSFDEDVTVYLFDQEIPTVELHSDSDPFRPCSWFHHMRTVEEDSGWEWEDDFQTLENTHHFQTAPRTVSLPSLEWTSPCRPKNRSLPHTCLVLTYIPESDLEL
ncbi:hypothetical protein OJAV_G00188090 [Oryzias javanicus]|uniref:Uncharacterized protein n=1 Tax=Oryzias javanicus TaxID=123683 RepID=A0A3S2PS05_ORYJA|nr:hypothetical protein OJAV_G00188090 [Oryzias javanicus]